MARIFPVLIPARILVLLVSDILLILGSFIVSCLVWLPTETKEAILGDASQQGWIHALADTVPLFPTGTPLANVLTLPTFWPVTVLLALVMILIGLYLQDLYTDIYVKSRVVLLQQLCLAVGIAFLLQGTLAY